MLERIVYISAAQERQEDASVERILTVARERNAANGITGLLIGGGCWWMQLLEGERPRLEPVWQSIRHDPRHSPVVLVQRRPLVSRAFPDWSLRFRKAGDSEFGALVEELTGGVRDPRLKEQVTRFVATFVASNKEWRELPA